jgi:hypothetical protein
VRNAQHAVDEGNIHHRVTELAVVGEKQDF